MDVPPETVVSVQLEPPVNFEDWKECVIEHMPVALRAALQVGLKKHYHLDECIAEAYFLLVVNVLRCTSHTFERVDFELVKHLRHRIRRGLQDYFKRNKPANMTDILGPDWYRQYCDMCGFYSFEAVLEELFNELARNDYELSVLIMKSKGYRSEEIAAALNFDVDNVRRTLRRMRQRLENNRALN